MDLGPQTKITWKMLLGLIAFVAFFTMLFKYFNIENVFIQGGILGGSAVLIMELIKKRKKP